MNESSKNPDMCQISDTVYASKIMNHDFFFLWAWSSVIHGQLGAQQLLGNWDSDKVTAVIQVVGQPSEGKRTRKTDERWCDCQRRARHLVGIQDILDNFQSSGVEAVTIKSSKGVKGEMLVDRR
jgi:hypothetical protein